MNKLTLTLAASLFLGGLGFGLASASAAPAVPAVSILADQPAATEARYHHRRGLRHRSMRRARARGMSDPNARNPSQPGYQQQKGNTSGGPRY